MITINEKPLDLAFTFNGGERQIRLPEIEVSDRSPHIHVVATLKSSDDIMDLLLVSNALEYEYKGHWPIYIYINYLPYARQDRVCYQGEANGSEVMQGIIKMLKAVRISVADVHSEQDLPVNVLEVSAAKILLNNPGVLEGISALVAPDAGSTEKVKEIGKLFNIPVIYCNKVRNSDTGLIEGIEVSSGSDLIENGNLLVIDDICDGGATFNFLADLLETYGIPNSLNLYITHGIFSKGEGVLLNRYDTIATTDSYYVDTGIQSNRITIIKL